MSDKGGGVKEFTKEVVITDPNHELGSFAYEGEYVVASFEYAGYIEDIIVSDSHSLYIDGRKINNE